MKKKMLFITKIIVALIAFIIVTLLTVPLFFEDEIIAKTKEIINENINAKVDFESISLSLLKDFPNLSLKIANLSVINKPPFEGDTLVYAGELFFKLSLKTLIKKEEDPYEINRILIKDSKIQLLINNQGVANYDITKQPTENQTNNVMELSHSKKEALPDKKKKNDSETSTFRLTLKEYTLKNVDISYKDDSTGLEASLKHLNHSSSGLFGSKAFNVKTKTSAKANLSFDKVNYIRDNQMNLKATIKVDMNQHKYTFLENEFELNRLKLNFNGFIKLQENGEAYHLNFNTPSTSFLSFLEMIPNKYTQSLKGVKTKGTFSITGQLDGLRNEHTIPKFKVDIIAKNGMFHYPNLPETANDIDLKTRIFNDTGDINDTKIDISNLSFRLGQDVFEAHAKVSNIIENPTVSSVLKGKIDLSKIKAVYPLPKGYKLSGKLTTDINAGFNSAMIEKNNYEKASINGLVKITDLQYHSKDFPHPINIKDAQVHFVPGTITLKKFEANSGKSDFKINGNLNNLLGFLFKNETIQGHFQLKSKHFSVKDFVDTSVMSETPQKKEADKLQPEKTSEKEPFRIPKFLDCTFDANIQSLTYDNLTLANMIGLVTIKNQVVYLKNLNFNLFQGNINVNGLADTGKEKMFFKTNLDIKNLDINTSFNHIEMLKKIAPISDALSGRFSTITHLKGLLNNDYTPDNNSLDGDISLSLEKAKFTPEHSKTLTLLEKNLSFINLKKANLKDLKVDIVVKDQKVKTKPFKYKQDDIEAIIKGTYGFNQQINYNVNVDLPIKYLGGDVNELVEKTDDPEIKNAKVPLAVDIIGTTSNPKINFDWAPAINEAKQTLKKQTKKRVKEEVKNQVNGLLNKVLNQDNKKESSEEKALKEKANDLINSLFK